MMFKETENIFTPFLCHI